MFVRIQQLSPPANALITPTLARQHTRIDNSADDNLLAIYINTATRIIEKYINQSILTQTLQMTYAETCPPVDWPMTMVPFPVLPLVLEWIVGQMDNHTVELFYGPAQAVNSVTLVHWSGNTVALVQNIDYSVDTILDPPRIRMHREFGPAFHAAHYEIVYTAGMSANASGVEMPIIHAALLTTAKLYEHRGDNGSEELLTRSAKSLLDGYRRPVFGG